jgi:hypothetical protein
VAIVATNQVVVFALPYQRAGLPRELRVQTHHAWVQVRQRGLPAGDIGNERRVVEQRSP